ncbi:hypothetical protein SAMN03159488_01586 [Pseudomonas sp. NFIX10]|uniref:hypothetical protein n=1 Tax=unclassified Pseudomonas TaxID=196821 RepID=UPI0008E9BA7B|nr:MULTISPECIES: hypothetical protein [unclassified Pseudomonas]SFB03555.1 hypothetical protein SAMN03159488_01586 [Pseudomonas sp. NFIX10]SFE59329.1 hypothetical protein SAMN03159367_01586 [Pseudomonas sp. NFACC06-1]
MSTISSIGSGDVAAAIGGLAAKAGHIVEVMSRDAAKARAMATLGLPASNAITRRVLGWEPTQPGLFADLDNGHYFPAD